MHAHSFFTFAAIHSAPQSSCEKARFEPFHPFAQCLSTPQSHPTRRKGANDAFRAFLAAPFPQAASKRMWPHSFFAFLRCIPAPKVVEKGSIQAFPAFQPMPFHPVEPSRSAERRECQNVASFILYILRRHCGRLSSAPFFGRSGKQRQGGTPTAPPVLASPPSNETAREAGGQCQTMAGQR